MLIKAGTRETRLQFFAVAWVYRVFVFVLLSYVLLRAYFTDFKAQT